MNIEEIQSLADRYFESEDLQSAIKLYKQCVQSNLLSNQVIEGLGNIQDQKGYYVGRVGKWYNDAKRRKMLKGSPFSALSLIFSTHSYINFAKEYFLRLLQKYPNNYQILLTLGHVEANLRNYKKAQAFYQQAIAILPNIQHAYSALGSLYFYQFNDELKARQYSIKALYCNKDNMFANIIFNFTSLQSIQAKISSLLEIYHKIPQISSKIKNLIGCILYQDGDYPRSKAFFQQTIQESPIYVSPYIGISTILIKSGQYELAENYLLRALNLDPSCRQVYNNLGNICLYTGDYQSSIQWFYTASQCSEQYFQSYYGLGNCYYIQQDYESAIDWYKQALQRQQNRYEIYQSLGNCFIRVGQYEKANQYYIKCFEINNSFEIFHQIIKIFIKCQRYKDGVNFIRYNITNVGEYLEVTYFLLGYCHLMLEQSGKARQSYQKSLELCPQFEEALQCLNAFDKLQGNI